MSATGKAWTDAEKAGTAADLSFLFTLPRRPTRHLVRHFSHPTARRMPGVLFVVTGEAVRADGLGDVPCMVPLVNRDGTPRHDTPRPVLAIGKVRHVGQPVALVVAETLTAARDAAEAIEVEYDPLPAITEAKDAISPGAPQLFDHIASNIVFDWDNDMGDAKATGIKTQMEFARQVGVTRSAVSDPRAELRKIPGISLPWAKEINNFGKHRYPIVQ